MSYNTFPEMTVKKIKPFPNTFYQKTFKCEEVGDNIRIYIYKKTKIEN